MTQPTEGSLFSGYGGISRAVEQVYGARTIWNSDIDPGANKILAHRFPGVPNLGDISIVDWSGVERPNILTGGFPCQDVSPAGKRAGMLPNTRSGLWAMMAVAIDQLHPDLVVIENVRGLLSARSTDSIVESCEWCVGDGSVPHMRALGVVLGDLADIGYDAQWVGLRAADVGAPHGRFRVFITAHPQGKRQQRSGRTRGWWTGSANSSGSARELDLLPTPNASDWKRDDDPADARRHSPGLTTVSVHFPQLLPTPRATDGTNGGPNQRGSSGDLMLPSAVLSWGNYAAAIARWEPVVGRPAPPPTVVSEAWVAAKAKRFAGKAPGLVGRRGSLSRFLKPAMQLSPVFVEWMMGLPLGHVTAVGLTRNQQLKALGNGVVPQQAAEALRRLDLIASTY